VFGFTLQAKAEPAQEFGEVPADDGMIVIAERPVALLAANRGRPC